MNTNAAVVLSRHVSAVEKRDIEMYASTLHDDALVILPTGKRLEGKDAIVDFHTGWFADDDWTQRMTLVRMTGDDTSLTAVYDVEYHDIDDAGEEINREYLLSLVFVRSKDGQWSMLHDQCTIL